MLALIAMAYGTSSACGTCHVAEYARWRTSRHAVAASNPVFAASWTSWPNGWCLGCHAPAVGDQTTLIGGPARAGVLATPLLDPGAAETDGVGCLACHGTDDGELVTGRVPSERAVAIHPIRQDERVGDERLCATCHEFAFQQHTPRWPFASGPDLAQSTVSEYRRSVAALQGKTCATCHLDGHRFPGAHDEDFVRDAVSVNGRQRGDRLTVVVLAPQVAHAFPSGDPFRRVELQLCADVLCDEVEPVGFLSRTLERTAQSWTTADDTRLEPGERRVFEVSVGSARAWRVVYRYGERRFESGLPPNEVGYRLAGGMLKKQSL